MQFWLQYLYIYLIIIFFIMLTNLQQELSKATNHLKSELSKLQTWRANPAIVEDVFVMAYGSLWPLKNIASVSILDAQTITIQPWDKALMHDIEKGISDANLWLNPTNNGESILIKIPALTQERRQDLVKLSNRLTEDWKVSIRNIRGEYKKKIDKAKSDKEMGEDEIKILENDLQKQIDAATKEMDELAEKKEIEIMKV